jgi:nickel-type superoxide dismutase maturation protease
MIGAAMAWAGLRPRRVEVEGASMLPALLPGDRLLVLRERRPRPGDVVALPDPRQPDRLIVKRVTAVRDGTVTVLGDNAAASTDSRTFGAVAAGALLGRARYRYAPPERVGPLGRRPPHR